MKKYVKDLQIGDVIIHSYGQRTFLGFAENQDQSPLMKDWVEILLFDEKHQRNINITVKYSNQVEVRDVFTLEYIINYLEEFFYSKECHDLARNKKQCFLEGLQILSKYDADVVPEFDHDICWASSFEDTATKMTLEELRMLSICGWTYDTENECWAHR